MQRIGVTLQRDGRGKKSVEGKASPRFPNPGSIAWIQIFVSKVPKSISSKGAFFGLTASTTASASPWEHWRRPRRNGGPPSYQNRLSPGCVGAIPGSTNAAPFTVSRWFDRRLGVALIFVMACYYFLGRNSSTPVADSSRTGSQRSSWVIMSFNSRRFSAGAVHFIWTSPGVEICFCATFSWQSMLKASTSLVIILGLGPDQRLATIPWIRDDTGFLRAASDMMARFFVKGGHRL